MFCYHQIYHGSSHGNMLPLGYETSSGSFNVLKIKLLLNNKQINSFSSFKIIGFIFFTSHGYVVSKFFKKSIFCFAPSNTIENQNELLQTVISRTDHQFHHHRILIECAMQYFQLQHLNSNNPVSSWNLITFCHAKFQEVWSKEKCFQNNANIYKTSRLK